MKSNNGITKDMTRLLTREEFKKQTFARTSGKCCCPGCTNDAVNAHHIMDRKLWSDGGYYLSNGAALCSDCHLKAEHREYSPKDMFTFMDIHKEDLLVPQSLSEYLTREEYIELLFSEKLDKWGKLKYNSYGTEQEKIQVLSVD